MSRRVNLVLDDAVKASLDELIPAGRRSEFVNRALESQLSLLRRQRAVESLQALRDHGPSVSTVEVVDLLRKSRERSV